MGNATSKNSAAKGAEVPKPKWRLSFQRTSESDSTSPKDALCPKGRRVKGTRPPPAEEHDTTAAAAAVVAAAATAAAAAAHDCFEIIPLSQQPAIGLPHDILANGPPIPPCMDARNATVTFLNTLQPPSDPELDNILSLICNIMESPAAFIALFDDKHIFCRNTTGMKRGDFPWRWSMCAWTMQKDHPQTLVVEDVDKDARFADNEGARGLGVKFYVGSPLVASNGHRLGSICFVDSKPRKMDAYHCQILNNFSELVVRELEKDIALQIKTKEHSQLEQVYGQLQRGMDCFQSPVLFVSTAQEPWRTMHCNEAWLHLTGLSREETMLCSVQDMFATSPGKSWSQFQKEVAAGKAFSMDGVRCSQGHCASTLSLLFRPAGKDTLSSDSIPIGVPSFVLPEAAQQQHFYFVTITQQQQQQQQLDPPGSPTAATSSSCLSSSTATTVSTSAPDSASNARSRGGKTLDGLEVSTLLGCGAQGRVYFGHWYGIDVAVKVIENMPSWGMDSKGKEGSCADALEAVLSVDLLHPNVVRTLSFTTIRTGEGNSDSFDDSAMALQACPPPCAAMQSVFPTETWIIMEFCDRGTLLDAVDKGWLRTTPSLSEGLPHMPAILATAHEIAAAMAYLHTSRIIHGDLTAANVMLCSSGAAVDVGGRGFVAKVSDFGLSRGQDVQSRIKTNSYGTVTHMPPELLQLGILSQATDVYAFGVLLWEMYTGSRPWPGLSHGQIIQLVSVDKRTLLLPPGTYPAYEALVHQCMAFDPKERPTFRDICNQLDDMRGPVTSSSTSAAHITSDDAPSWPCLNSASGFEDL